LNGTRSSAADDGASLLARLEAVPFSGWHRRARLVVGSATFFDAFDALSIAFVLPMLRPLWNLGNGEIAWLITASYIGQVAGALLFSRLAERFGRIKSVTAAVAIMSVLSVGCALAGNAPALFACRLLQGIGVGGEMPVAAAYIGELSGARRRGRFFLLYEMIFPLGLAAAGQAGAWLVPRFGWQIMFLLGGLPGLLISALLLRLPESPRWLIAQGRLGEAEAVIRAIEASTLGLAGSGLSRLPEQPLSRARDDAAHRAAHRAEQARWRELLSPVYARRSLIAWLLWASAFFVTNGINNWAPTLYGRIYGLPLPEALRAAALNNLAQVALLLLCALVIDRIGRRLWVLAAFLGGAVLLASLGLAPGLGVAAVVALVVASYGLIGSANAVLYLYTPEIYPTRMRALGTGAATFWLRVASAAAPLLVGYLLTEGGMSDVFLMFAGVSIAGALTAFGMIETRRRRLEEIAP
jgi:MFS transporter, putative metabolite:H+ symporter